MGRVARLFGWLKRREWRVNDNTKGKQTPISNKCNRAKSMTIILKFSFRITSTLPPNNSAPLLSRTNQYQWTAHKTTILVTPILPSLEPIIYNGVKRGLGTRKNAGINIVSIQGSVLREQTAIYRAATKTILYLFRLLSSFLFPCIWSCTYVVMRDGTSLSVVLHVLLP